MSIEIANYKAKFEEHDFMATFVGSLFAESKKRRVKEGSEGLTAEAARRTIGLLKSEIVGFQKATFSGSLYWTGADYDALALILASYARENRSYTSCVAKRLREYRSELFKKDQFFVAIEGHDDNSTVFAFYVEHPMITFNKALDFIEFEERTDRTSFFLKLNLVNLARVGNAMLDRSEWVGELVAREQA